MVHTILLNRNPWAYDRKTSRRMRPMKMNPKLVMAGLGEEEVAQKAAKIRRGQGLLLLSYIILTIHG
jgi:hypothetical protein